MKEKGEALSLIEVPSAVPDPSSAHGWRRPIGAVLALAVRAIPLRVTTRSGSVWL